MNQNKYISYVIHSKIYSIFFILLVASFLRLINLDYGLPTVIHPDENIVSIALDIASPSKSGLDPNFYNYPAFQIYILSSFYYLQGALSHGGSWASPMLPDQTTAIYMARLITTFFGIASIGAIYLLGLMVDTHLTGVFASLLLAITPFHVADSHYANVDIPMTFWIIIALVCAFRYLRSSRLIDFFSAAACIGLAGATKYTGLSIGCILPMAALLVYKSNYRKTVLVAVMGCLVCCAFFIAGAPYTLIKLKDVMDKILWERMHVGQGHWGFDTLAGGVIYKPFVYQLCAGFPFVMGIPLYLTSVSGFITSLSTVHRPKLFLLLSAFVPMAFIILSAVVVFPRYLLPLIPFAVLFAGYLFSHLIYKQSKRFRLTGLVLLAAVAIYSFAMSKSLVDGLKPQNSILSSNWVLENIKPGSEIAIGIHIWTLSLPANRYRLLRFDARSAVQNAYKPQWLIISGWYDKAWQRGDLAKSKTNAYLQSLGTPKSEYESIITFKTTFFNEHIYEQLDPYFGNQFESPDISVFKLKTSK